MCSGKLTNPKKLLQMVDLPQADLHKDSQHSLVLLEEQANPQVREGQSVALRVHVGDKVIKAVVLSLIHI